MHALFLDPRVMAEASGSGEWQLPDFGSDNKPNQPPQFDFPKREFGKTKPVKRLFQAQWFMKWKWLHYDCSRDLVEHRIKFFGGFK